MTDQHVNDTGLEGGPGGHHCPECGVPRGADNTPSCTCTQRASDALREARTAEAAAAEDFDLLRIRPYVELEGAGLTHGEPAPAPPAWDPAATMPLRAVVSPEPEPGIRFEAPEPPSRMRPSPPKTRARRPRHPRTALLGAAAAVAAVAAAAALSSGLFSYEPPSRNSAAPEDVRAAVPETSTSTSTEAASATPSMGPAPEPPAPQAPAPTRTTSPSPSPSRTSASPTPSPTATPTTTASPTPSAGGPEAAFESADSADSEGETAPALRRGDVGPEVSELQCRLRQLGLFNNHIDGSFDKNVEDAVQNYQWSRGIQDDEQGVYGTATRARLESETKDP